MNTEILKEAIERKERLRLRKNELSRLLKIKNGDKQKVAQREYTQKYRDKIRNEAEEATKILTKDDIVEVEKKDVKKDVKKDKKEIKKDEPKHIIRLEKDKGELKSNFEKTGEKGVKEKTSIDYIYKISVIHKEFTKDKLDIELLKKVLLGNGTDIDEDKLLENMPYLKDVELLIKTIDDKYPNKQSKKGYTAPFLTLTSYLKCLNKINYIKLRTKFEEINSEIYEYRAENKVSPNENMIDTFEEDVIIENSKGLDRDDKLLYQFLTLQPPRRNDDINKIFLIDKGYDDKNMNKKRNYIVIDDNKKPIEIVYNSYKTDDKYGRQFITLTNENLINTIHNHIVFFNMSSGSKLFRLGLTKDNVLRADAMGRVIKRVFSKVYDKKITLNNIRHSYITWELREARNVNYLNNLAMMMGHNGKEQALYRRV